LLECYLLESKRLLKEKQVGCAAISRKRNRKEKQIGRLVSYYRLNRFSKSAKSAVRCEENSAMQVLGGCTVVIKAWL